MMNLMKLAEIKLQFPNAGIRTMIGHLESQGLHIQETRVRQSMHRVDPEGIIERWLRLKPILEVPSSKSIVSMAY